MRPRNGFLLFLAMHLVVVASFFSFTVSRGHDVGRSVTCSAIWGVLSALLWMGLALRERHVALVGFAVASMCAAAMSGLLALVQFGSAPYCLLAVLLAGGLTAWSGRAR